MDIKSVIMGLTFALIWSSAFTSARIIVQVAPPLSISALRFLIAGLIAVSIAYILGQRAKFSYKQRICAKFLSETKKPNQNFGFGRNFVTKICQKPRMLGVYRLSLLMSACFWDERLRNAGSELRS